MCGCDAHYVCPRCTGTPADPLYVADEPRDEPAERHEHELTALFILTGVGRDAS